ncbi:MAG: SIMPL domain-containing protein [Caldilineaceae bacterium]|nr:SIMPL domain-containing protein [Caldilineaceae bacterium]
MKQWYMRLAVSLSALLLVSLVAWPAASNPVGAQMQPPLTETTPRTITVSGMGEVDARPDRAVVNLGVETQAQSASEAIAQNNEQMQALINAMTDAGIADENIQTQVVRLSPQYEDQPPLPPQPTEQVQPMQQQTVPRAILGYVAVNTVQVRVEDLESVGEILDAAIEAGSNRIDGISFEISDSAQLLVEAREAAWNNALQKAEQLAALAGAELGEVLNINASDQGPFPVMQETFAMDAARVPIQPGMQSVSTNLQVTWRLQ